MTRSISALILVLLCAGAAQAQRKPQKTPPDVGRPDDFSQIVGTYEIKATATPLDVEVEQAIELRVSIIGETPRDYRPKYDPNRAHLRIFPEGWSKNFYVEEIQERHELHPAKKTWTFVYRLKPKHTRIKAIDEIKLVYYDPSLPEKRRFVTRYADAIPLRVKPRVEKTPTIAIDPPIAPESFYQHVPVPSERWVRPGLSLSLLHVALFLTMPPLLCLAGAFWWKRTWPSESERRRRQRSRAAEQALARLSNESGAVDEIVSRYMQERFDLPQSEPTPAEVERHFHRLGFAKELYVRAEALFQACDAQRYGLASQQQALADEARALIVALEADPCAK